MNRPKIKIEREPIDIILECVGFTGLIFLIVIPIYYYGVLPEQIPAHYGFDGKPDRYSDKSIIWLLPAIGSVMYVGLFILNQFPHIFNYTQKITPENAAK